ncbi:hypothetical protein AQV86_04360 [Nanohaloarchaea archaeon SG9]|nr:hypothetical protein AQV86_04360 [Nanohaloarchaea archaeon SG9]
MGYLSSAIGKPVKWIGGATALYAGYKLAKNNSDDIKNSLGGAVEGLENGEGDGMDAVYGFLDSTNEQIDQNPEYGANLGTAGKGLAAAVIGAYLDGSFSNQEMALPEVEPQDYGEDQNDGQEEQEEVIPGYTQLGTVDREDGEYMLLRSTDDDSEIYSVPMTNI